MKLYYILLRFINKHDPILIGITDNPDEYIRRFVDQNGYKPQDPVRHVVDYDISKDCHLWVGHNYSGLDCKIVSNTVKPTGFFWLDLTGDAKYSLIK